MTILKFIMGNFFNRKQNKELLEELKLENIRRYADRLRVILLLDDRETYKNIAKHLYPWRAISRLAGLMTILFMALDSNARWSSNPLNPAS